jgi:hypothetical protein
MENLSIVMNVRNKAIPSPHSKIISHYQIKCRGFTHMFLFIGGKKVRQRFKIAGGRPVDLLHVYNKL